MGHVKQRIREHLETIEVFEISAFGFATSAGAIQPSGFEELRADLRFYLSFGTALGT